jgi:hypothetical protein
MEEEEEDDAFKKGKKAASSWLLLRLASCCCYNAIIAEGCQKVTHFWYTLYVMDGFWRGDAMRGKVCHVDNPLIAFLSLSLSLHPSPEHQLYSQLSGRRRRRLSL